MYRLVCLFIISTAVKDPLKYKEIIMHLLKKSSTKKLFNKAHLTNIIKSGDSELSQIAALSFIPKEVTDIFDIQMTPKSATKKSDKK
jgi:hypothetical protein